MPQQLPPQGPYQRTGGGCFFTVEERVSLQPNLLIEDPPARMADMNPPECWVELTYERRRVDVEWFRIVEYLAREKPISGWAIAGLVVLGIVVVASGVGAVAAFAGAASAAATAGTATAVVSVKVGIGGALTAVAVGTGSKGVDYYKEVTTHKASNPDDWEITTTVLNTSGPFRRELNPRPERPRVERFTIPCDRPITGVNEFINTNDGLDTGATPPPDAQPSGSPAGGGTAPVGSGTGTAPVGSGTGGP